MATQLVDSLISGIPPGENPEFYECINGQWKRKQSAGRDRHSDLEMAVLMLLKPFEKSLGGRVRHEWTIAYGRNKLIPDVTFSFPEYTLERGYLVAPAWLVVETSSEDQRLSSLFKKCREQYHPSGTPYCWILDSEEEVGYECHQEMGGAIRLVDELTAGPQVKIAVADIFKLV